MVWIWLVATSMFVVWAVVDLALSLGRRERCQGPGPHQGELFVVQVTVSRLTVLCHHCRSRRNQNNRQYLFTFQREEMPNEHCQYRSNHIRC